MKLVLILVVGAFTTVLASKVPDKQEMLIEDTNKEKEEASTEINYCKSQPCKFVIYDPKTELEVSNFTNHFCECKPGKSCQFHRNDKEAFTLFYLCK